MAKRGRKIRRRRRYEEGEGRAGNGVQTREEPQPQDSRQSSPTIPHLTSFQVSPLVSVDSPSKAYSSGHRQAVPIPCAALRPAKRVKEESVNPIDNNMATPVHWSFPDSKDDATTEQTDSTFHPQTLGSEDCQSVAALASLDHLINNVVSSVIPQARNSSRSRYPLRHVRNVPPKRASPRLAMRVKQNETFINSAAESADGSSPVAQNVPTAENCTAQLPPQGQRLQKSNPNPPLEHLNSTTPIFVPIVTASVACVGNTNTSDPMTLKEAEIEPPTFIENMPEKNGESLSRNNVHIARSHSFNVSEMVDLMDDGSSSQSEVDYPGNDHPLVTVEGYRVEAEFAPTLRLVLSKHGDIAANSSLESLQSRSSFMEIICGVIKELERSVFAEVTIGDFKRMQTVVRDAINVRFDVNWLEKRLDDIIKAKQAVNESGPLIKARNKNKEDVEEIKKELKALKEKVRLTDENLAAMVVEATDINTKLLRTKEQVKCFYQRSLVEGLL